MLRIWLARHGEAVDPDEASSDFARVLTNRGRRRISEFTRWIIGREEIPELILHSPLIRAQQTADAIAIEIGKGITPVRVENRLAPGCATEKLLTYLSNTALERVVCVGHQPDMSRCLAEMIGGGNHLFSPGSVACIEFNGPIIQNAGQLRWHADPHWFD